jgi:hypothetical protein
MNEKENIVSYPNSIDTRVALLEQSINHIKETLKEINSELKTHFRWTMGLIGGMYLTMFGSLLTVVIKFSH